VRQLARAAGGGGMVGGQWLDLLAEGRAVDVAELEAIHARKTGALFAASMRVGAILADAEDGTVEAVGACGAALGLAFQIADDVLDEVGEAALLGKTAGRDREREKAAYPALVGLEAARTRAASAAGEAVAALRAAGLHNEVLESLIGFAIERDR
jgi:geranylgeranyl pyrophosphate synthase